MRYPGACDLHSNVTILAAPHRPSKLRRLAYGAFSLLFIKLLLSILYEYRWYFPPDFDSAFLTGRQHLFVGLYRAAFYAHLVSGPLALVLASFLMLSGGRSRYRHIHRYAGRSQMLIVIFAVAPSGFVMALWAHSGRIAAVGFAMLSLCTAATAIVAIIQARARQFRSHQQWATRCFVLLCSPLLLRLLSGALIVLQWDSDLTYRLNAWLSWLIPLVTYELWWRRKLDGGLSAPLPRQPSSPESAIQ